MHFYRNRNESSQNSIQSNVFNLKINSKYRTIDEFNFMNWRKKIAPFYTHVEKWALKTDSLMSFSLIYKSHFYINSNKKKNDSRTNMCNWWSVLIVIVCCTTYSYFFLLFPNALTVSSLTKGKGKKCHSCKFFLSFLLQIKVKKLIKCIRSKVAKSLQKFQKFNFFLFKSIVRVCMCVCLCVAKYNLHQKKNFKVNVNIEK